MALGAVVGVDVGGDSVALTLTDGVPVAGTSGPFSQARLTASTEASPSHTIHRVGLCASPSTALPAAIRA